MTTPQQSPSSAWRGFAPELAIGFVLTASILLVYGQVAHFDFTYDDDLHVCANPHVLDGLTAENIRYAFTAVVSNNWTPVTMLSHIIAGQLFRLDAGAHHLVNVAFHIAASILLFLVFLRATRARWPSGFVALVFALHPLHVASAVWVSERKDVLSAFFWFLALYFYVRYARHPSRRLYLLVAGLFCLGLMSKPMLVTFPLTLLLFDFWPLRRWVWPNVVLEKLPLFVLSAISAGVAFSVQPSAGAVHAYPLATRAGNALISYVVYISQMFWPLRLAAIYPYARTISPWDVAGALALLSFTTALVVLARHTFPYLAVGWFWYVGTLLPVIGLVQVGVQSHADRYTYVPMIGLTVMLAWGAAEVVKAWPWTRFVAIAAAATAGLVCPVMAWQQAGYWRDSETLYRHAIDVTRDNWVAHYDLGHYLMSKPDRQAEAKSHFEAALRIQPDYAAAHSSLGSMLMNSGQSMQAIPHFEAALRQEPNSADLHYNLARALSNMGDDTEAMAQYETALRLRPEIEMAHNDLGLLLVKHGLTAEAIPHFEAAVRLNPSYANEHNLGAVLLSMPGRQSDALVHLEEAQRLHPDPQLADILSRLRATKK